MIVTFVVTVVVCVVDTTCFVEDFEVRGMCVNGLGGSTVLDFLLSKHALLNAENLAIAPKQESCA